MQCTQPAHTNVHIYALHVHENNNFNENYEKEKQKSQRYKCLWPFTVRVLFVSIGPRDIQHNGENSGF